MRQTIGIAGFFGFIYLMYLANSGFFIRNELVATQDCTQTMQVYIATETKHASPAEIAKAKAASDHACGVVQANSRVVEKVFSK